MNNDIVKKSQDDSLTLPENSRVASIDDSCKTKINTASVLGHLAQYANIASIINNIKRSAQYVVQVPAHLQASLESGKFTMLHGADSGKTWATIVEKLPNGKNKFIANCPIKEEAFYPGNPLESLSGSFANLQLQRQMAALVEMLGQTYEAIQRVEAGQTDDRIGQLNAGRQGIILALQMTDTDSQRLQIVVARGSLQEAQSKIAETLKRRI